MASPENSTPEPTMSLLEAQEQIGPLVSYWTGVKSQFMEQGWGEKQAERMTVEMARLFNTQTERAVK